MSLKHKVPLICFLVLTMFSISFLSYTLYVVFGTSWAIRSMTVQLSEVEIRGGDSEAYFLLVIYNPSNVRLGIIFLRAEIYFGGSYIGRRELGFQSKPLWLLTYAETNFTITMTLKSNGEFYSDGVWQMYLYMRIETPLLDSGIYTTTVEK